MENLFKIEREMHNKLSKIISCNIKNFSNISIKKIMNNILQSIN